MFELVDSNLVQFLDRKAAAKTRLTCSTWRQSLDSAQVSAAPYGSIKPTRLVSLFPNITSLNLEHALAEQLLPDHLLTLTKAYGDQLLT